MAKKKITELVDELLADFLKECGMELYHSEFVKEGKDWFLRVYIDRDGSQNENEYVSTDDCEKVSRFLSKRLDDEDPITQNYYLEVSSPGMDRILYRVKDFARFTGSPVEVSLYKAIDGKKSYSGTLAGHIDDHVVITDEKNNELNIHSEQVAKTQLAEVF